MSTPVTGWVDYDYAVVRVVPRVHTGTFINVGVVLHARTLGFLDARIAVDEERIREMCAPLDMCVLARALDAYARVCRGGVSAAPIGLLPPSERFHWLTAPRSAVLQTSPVHPGRCTDDPAEVLDRLFAEQCPSR